jgi:hypothetical protein
MQVIKCSKSPSPGAEILTLYRHGNPLAAVIIDSILVSPLLLVAITTCCFIVEILKVDFETFLLQSRVEMVGEGTKRILVGLVDFIHILLKVC